MLAIQKQPKYIQKAIQLPNGDWALVVFEMIERGGKVVAKAVSYKMLGDIYAEPSETLCLPCAKTPADFLPVKSIFSDFISTFSKDFSFIMSQPTRAPSL